MHNRCVRLASSAVAPPAAHNKKKETPKEPSRNANGFKPPRPSAKSAPLGEGLAVGCAPATNRTPGLEQARPLLHDLHPREGLRNRDIWAWVKYFSFSGTQMLGNLFIA